MKVLIVEDETAASDYLVDLLREIDTTIAIAGITESTSQTIKWMETNKAPDLIFMDIHLSDGSAFSIFELITFETPIIFTTAFDKYAIDAFKVNSIDYLLKPVKVVELKRAVDKYRRWSKQEIKQYISHTQLLSIPVAFSNKILVPVRNCLLPVNLSDISFFYTTDKSTCIYLKNNKVLPYAKTLEQIEKMLNPADFIRANKQFILSRNSVQNLTVWFDSRLLISTDIETPERIFVSKNNASAFKSWMIR